MNDGHDLARHAQRIYAAMQAVIESGRTPVRIWLAPSTMTALTAALNNRQTIGRYNNVPITPCLPGDPGERVVASDGIRCLIP